MGGVAKAVGNIVGGAAEAVGDVFEAVGNVVEDVWEAVQDVGAAIDDYVIQPIKNDPVTFAVQLAASAAGIPPPVTAAAITASKGGSVSDIGKSALAAYAAPKVGNVVGQQVASAAAGSSLQNVLASAAAGAASGATTAVIRGGDIGQSALLGAAGSAGASLGRDIATAGQYGTDPLSAQTRQLASQDFDINRFSNIGSDIGAALGRAAITGDLEGELAGAAIGTGSREIADILRYAFATGGETDEVKKAEVALSAELEANPAFAEQLRLAEIAAGDQPLTTDQKIDALAEAVARDVFAEAVDGGEQVAALPALALPIAANAARQAAINAAPEVVRRIARFAANDPRFAQVMVTNPYTQQLLAAAGITMSVSITGDVSVNPIQYQDQSAAETARLNRYASEVVKTVPNAQKENVQRLETAAKETQTRSETTGRQEALTQRQEQLRALERQGFPVQQELARVQDLLKQPAPGTEIDIPAQPGTLPPPTIDISAPPQVTPTPRPGGAPAEEAEPMPEPMPEARPTAREQTEADARRRPEARTVQRLEPAPKIEEPVGTTRVPIDIETLFTDQDILDFITQGLGEDFVTVNRYAAGADEIETAGEGQPGAVVDRRGAVVGKERTPVSITGRSVGTGPSAITGMKEPTFGGDPGQQQDVWNVRSLRLRKALGL
jgi:hypothetical protein